MKIGDIDVLKSIIQLEHDVIVLQKCMDYIRKNNPNVVMPSQNIVDSFKDEAAIKLQKKYPNMGIARRKKPGA